MREKRVWLIGFFIFVFLLITGSALAFLDLTVDTGDIGFSVDEPIEGETITINANITNLGDENATDVKVQFLDDSMEIGNTTINISASSTTNTSQLWEAEIGPNTITVVVDPDDTIVESDETNNQASNDLAVSAYHIYYGTAKSYLSLGIKSDFLLKSELVGCNVLVADSDSNVDFGSLQALGKRKYLGRAFNDFREVDILLGMTDFPDSISNLYTWFGWLPKEIKTFILYNDTISRIAVIDSINSSNFKTGILWDTSDNSGFFGQFDIIDQEDLIFVTETNPQQEGAYGVYDYEIKVPALLRDYKSGSSTVDFFIDLESLPCS